VRARPPTSTLRRVNYILSLLVVSWRRSRDSGRGGGGAKVDGTTVLDRFGFSSRGAAHA